MKLKVTRQRGFTLVELTIAMAVFSLMLLVVSKGFLGVVHLQQSGVASRNTQQEARLLMEQIVREARTATDVRVNGAAPNQTICLVTAGGLSEYYIKTNHLYHGTVDYNSGYNRATDSCNVSPTFTSETDLTSGNVAVVDLEGTVSVVAPLAGQPLPAPSLDLKMRVASSNHTTNTACNPGPSSQFCSTTDLSSTVSLRGTP